MLIKKRIPRAKTDAYFPFRVDLSSERFFSCYTSIHLWNKITQLEKRNPIFLKLFRLLTLKSPLSRIWPPSEISRIALATPFQDQAPPVEEPSLLVHRTHTPRLLQNSQGLGETFWSAILQCNAFHLTRIIRRLPARGHLTNEHYIATESHEMTRNNNFRWEQVWKLKTRPWNNFP